MPSDVTGQQNEKKQTTVIHVNTIYLFVYIYIYIYSFRQYLNLFLGPTKAWYTGVRFDDLRRGERITWGKGVMGWNWVAGGGKEKRRSASSSSTM